MYAADLRLAVADVRRRCLRSAVAVPQWPASTACGSFVLLRTRQWESVWFSASGTRGEGPLMRRLVAFDECGGVGPLGLVTLARASASEGPRPERPECAFVAATDQDLHRQPETGQTSAELKLPYPAFGPSGPPTGPSCSLTSLLQTSRSGRLRSTLMGPTEPADRAPGTIGHDLGCRAWSPDSTRLLCQDRSSRATTRWTASTRSEPLTEETSRDSRSTRTRRPASSVEGDIPGDYSPDGEQFVFMRAKPGPTRTLVISAARCSWRTRMARVFIRSCPTA